MGRKRMDRGGYYADRKENKTNAKLERGELKIRLANAKANKRKWLAILLGLAIAIYFILSGSGLGVLNTIKGYLPLGE